MIEIKKNVYWCGIKDWELRRFHGHELSTHRGSSYNSYLVLDEKKVLVDTVWYPYKEKFGGMIRENLDGNALDYIIVNHMEPDHGGSLGELMDIYPEATIICTKNGRDIINKYFGRDWKFQIVKTGDTLNIGEYNLVFVEMQMIHWPDSMATFIKEAGVLLSNDAFGQHYAGLSLYNDEVDNCELYQEAIKYYANIVSPFNSLVKKKIDQVRQLNLDISMIAPSHGVIWRKDPMQIVDTYYKWSDNYSEDFVAIVYDTMYESTAKMAHAIAEGLYSKGMRYKLFNAAITDRSDLISELFRAKGMILGSCTINNTVLYSVSSIIDEIISHRFKNKCVSTFGSYGWSGEGPKVMAGRLEEAGFSIYPAPLSVRYNPDKVELKNCFDFGVSFCENPALCDKL